MAAKRILFIHQNFPGQFPHIVAAALAKGYKLAAIAGQDAKGVPGVDLRRWKLSRGSAPGLFDPATRAEADLLRACAAAEVATSLKKDGFIPGLDCRPSRLGRNADAGRGVSQCSTNRLWRILLQGARRWDVKLRPRIRDGFPASRYARSRQEHGPGACLCQRRRCCLPNAVPGVHPAPRFAGANSGCCHEGGRMSAAPAASRTPG